MSGAAGGRIHGTPGPLLATQQVSAQITHIVNHLKQGGVSLLGYWQQKDLGK